jgi:hypothetical protein
VEGYSEWTSLIPLPAKPIGAFYIYSLQETYEIGIFALLRKLGSGKAMNLPKITQLPSARANSPTWSFRYQSPYPLHYALAHNPPTFPNGPPFYSREHISCISGEHCNFVSAYPEVEK